MEYIWKIKHRPTGLYYCSVKGSCVDTKTKLSAKGNFYTSEIIVQKVFNENKEEVYINKAQMKRYNLIENNKGWDNTDVADPKDLYIVKYKLEEIRCHVEK